MKIHIALFIIILLTGCEHSSEPGKSNSTNRQGYAIFSLEKNTVPSSVKTLKTQLSRAGFEPFIRTINILPDSSALIKFDNVPIGLWKVNIEGRDLNEVLLYSGESEVTIVENNVTTISVFMIPVTTGVGSISINIIWGNPPGTSRWTDFESNPILTKSLIQGFQTGVTLPKLLFMGEQYFMWFSTTYGKGGVGLAKSYDGKVWSEVNKTSLEASINGWDNGRIANGAIFNDNGLLRLYYNAFSNADNKFKTGMATSLDGIKWEKHSTPVLTATSWCSSIVSSEVIKIGNLYLMYFSGMTTSGNRIGLATSSDGIKWVHFDNGPILSPSYNWEGNSVYYPSVKKEGNFYKMIYMGGKSGTESAFGEAISSDGLHWEKISSKPIFTQLDVNNSYPTNEISYPCFVKYYSQNRIYYNGFDYATNEWTIRMAYQ